MVDLPALEGCAGRIPGPGYPSLSIGAGGLQGVAVIWFVYLCDRPTRAFIACATATLLAMTDMHDDAKGPS
ncbi:hypothetical protein [Ruegeria jejuensis]|uniref:hypothetical protein n=1 Tax=Ruegeria jejuensis TaxID=3233338 RepID=UPI00355ACFA0